MTLAELLLATGLLLVIVGGAFTAYTASAGTERGTRARSESLLDARTGLERMARELRSAIPAAAAPTIDVQAQRLAFQKFLPGTSNRVWVLYDCGSGSCRRAQSAAGGSVPVAATATVVPGLQNADVFTLLGTNFVRIKLSVRNSSEIQQSQTYSSAPATLVDGVALRNFPGGTP